MSSIYCDLHQCVRHWTVLKEMNRQLTQQPIGYSEFTDPVLESLWDSVVITFGRILDNAGRVVSIRNLQNRLRKDKTAVTILDNFLSGNVDALEEMRTLRDKYVAHHDRVRRSPDHQLFRKLEVLIDSLEETFRELGGFLQQQDYGLDFDREVTREETSNVMMILQKEWQRPSKD